MELELSELNDRYFVERKIGEGWFSRVFLATDKDLRRQVALKVPHESVEDRHGARYSPTFASARLLAQLQHPSIATVFDINLKSEPFYVIEEYLARSVTLEMREGPLTPLRVADLMIRVAEALDYVHRRGFIHRNIKPGVILLDSTGLPRVTGFEIAHHTGEELTNAGAGSPLYTAPEQISGEDVTLGPHSDVWSFGVTLYQMLTGSRPFGRDGTLMTGILELTSKDPIPPHQLNPNIPEALERICLQCLVKDPSRRYASMTPILDALTDWRKGKQQVVRPRVFISHSTRDREFVEREIIPILEGQGIKTWYSKADIHTAAQWERSILEGLESCGWFLLVMSPRAAESEWVKDEVQWAIEKRVGKIIPVLIEDADVRAFHIRMARIQYVDFRNGGELAHAELLRLFQLEPLGG